MNKILHPSLTQEIILKIKSLNIMLYKKIILIKLIMKNINRKIKIFKILMKFSPTRYFR
jgi:hypothetical protein